MIDLLDRRLLVNAVVLGTVAAGACKRGPSPEATPTTESTSGAAPARTGGAMAGEHTLAPATMPKIGTVLDRFQSYNVEMLEVTGGRFWKPYGAPVDPKPGAAAPATAGDTPAGMDAACGGNPWSATFLDTFRYLDQLGRLARRGVQTVMHNTLAASDYSLLDEDTFAPKAAYWGALLWRRLMGTTVLDAGVPIGAGLHVYAHCLRGVPGGVALLLLNTHRTATQPLTVAAAGERFTLTAARLQGHDVQLDGRPLVLGDGDALPALTGVATGAGPLELAPATITFLALPSAGNEACR